MGEGGAVGRISAAGGILGESGLSTPGTARRLGGVKPHACLIPVIVLVFVCASARQLLADDPSVSYIFPPGGQRGETVEFKVGGHYLHGEAPFLMTGEGVKASATVVETETLWLEGPIIYGPPAQRGEDYPRDHLGTVVIAPDATPGVRHWRVSTSQGVTPLMRFAVGELPEIVEQEIDGEPIPERVELPLTINGRVFPREDVDIWTFELKKGQAVTARVDAQALGSPLVARLEIRQGGGATAVAQVSGSTGQDPGVRFVAPADGVYEARIHDVGFGGLQHYVYRLTLSAEPWADVVYPLGGKRGSTVELSRFGNGLEERLSFAIPADAPDWLALPSSIVGKRDRPLFLRVDDSVEMLEIEPNDNPAEASPAAHPGIVFNGRIDRAGDVDHWAFEAAKDDEFEFELIGGNADVPVFPSLEIWNEERRLAASPVFISPVKFAFKAPADGVFFARVSEKFASRGGPNHVYRLKLDKAESGVPDFRLTFSIDALSVLRDRVGPTEEQLPMIDTPRAVRWTVNAERFGGFDGGIELSAEGLPEGLVAAPVSIGKGQPAATIKFTAAPTTKIGDYPVTIRGTAKIGEKGAETDLTRTATFVTGPGEPKIEQLLVGVGMPAPFWFVGDYELLYVPRGSIHQRKYRLFRNGFEGPITVRLSDRQIRHLQGNTGPEFVINPGDGDEFFYPVELGPQLEEQRTSRTTIMLMADLVDHDGTKHRISYASFGQEQQAIVLATANLLTIELERASVVAKPGEKLRIPVRLNRDAGIANRTVEISLDIPAHVGGISAEPVQVAPGQAQAVFEVSLGEQAGPFNMPLTVRAVTTGEGDPNVALAQLRLKTE